MPTYYFRNRSIVAKPETTYAQDSSPGATDAIKCSSLAIELDPQHEDQAPITPTFGSAGELVPTRVSHTIDLTTVGVAGAGTAAGVVPWGRLLRAGGFAEVVTAGTKVEYLPITDSPDALTLKYQIGARLHSTLGARGTWTLRFKSGETPKVQMQLRGLFGAIATAALVAPDLSAWRTPLAVNRANTTATVFGVALPLYELELSGNVEYPHRNMVGAEDILITGREVKAKLVVESPALATLDLWAAFTAGTKGALALVHGAAAGPGNIIEVSAPAIVIRSLKPEDRDGVEALAIEATLTKVSGNDEIVIRTR